jgi:hypothetical protein
MNANYNLDATVRIIVNKPDANSYIACGTTATIGFAPVQDVTYLWYNRETGGSPISPTSNTCIVPPGEWWGEAQLNSKAVRPQFKFTVGARFTNATIAASGGSSVGAGSYTYTVNFGGESSNNVTCVWRVDGVRVSTATSWSASWTNYDEKLVTVDLTDATIKCTHTLLHPHHYSAERRKRYGCHTD